MVGSGKGTSDVPSPEMVGMDDLEVVMEREGRDDDIEYEAYLKRRRLHHCLR